nr:hypothetical protein [Flavobacterium sp.]
MKKNYNLKNLVYSIIVFFLSIFTSTYSQVRVNFAPRTAAETPNTSIYNIKGDFTMIGNTNLTLANYSNTQNNSNNTMIYVDVDNDGSTFNSSSATLNFSNENGAVPECSKVLFAGLYWTGRASDDSTSPNIFNVTKNNVTKTFDKRKIKLKGPQSSSYTEITANSNNIYYPTTNDGFMYSAFAEVTDYVRANGIGNYTVADMALVEGNGGGTGFYGGWSLVVVYENYKMKWRDVTIFDGHAYVQGNTTINHQIPVNGFNAVQNGPVNLKLGVMAGEGDVGISGDYFNILRSSDNNWHTLNHSENSATNFFNGTIQTGGNSRTPNLQNNTGLDIAMFNVTNTNNSIISNGQTSTTLRYGSTQDTYIINMVAFAVDAYIPDIEGLMTLTSVNGNPANNNANVTPGQEIEYSIKIYNEGSEEINNTQIKIDIPYLADYVPNSSQISVTFAPSPSPNTVIFDPNSGPKGSIIWNIGTLPIPSSPDVVLGELKYKIKITEDCFLLKNPNCVLQTQLEGFISGTGAISGISLTNKPFIQGYQSTGLCTGEPIISPIRNTIDATDFINQNCQNTTTELVFNFCNTTNAIDFQTIASNYPIGTKFYNSFPINSNSIEYTISNNFPMVPTANYIAVLPSENNCYYNLQINIVEDPTFNINNNVNLEGCDESVLPMSFSLVPISITIQEFINLGGTISNNLSNNISISYEDSKTGSCPLIIERTYTITSNCSTETLTQVFTIEDTTAPIISTPASDLTVACDGNGNTNDLNTWLASNGGALASDACSTVTWTNNFSGL